MGGGGSSGPTLQQTQLETEQALTTANLNLEENDQRKSILNSMQGTRVFRGSALSRALRGNAPGSGGNNQQGAPSKAQLTAGSAPITPVANSLLDVRQSRASGATTAGGTGASASAAAIAAANGAALATGSAGAGIRTP